MGMRKVWVGLGAVAGVLLVLTAVAFFIGKTQRDANVSKCTGNDPAAVIEGCTALIQSRFETTANQARAYFDRGNAYKKQGLGQQAIADYAKAIELKPDYLAAYNNRGNAFNDGGLYDRAIADFTKAIEIEPNNPVPYGNRGHTYNKTRVVFTIRRSKISPKRLHSIPMTEGPTTIAALPMLTRASTTKPSAISAR
jgi:tetratricopeptide (TPR) repeat protein